MHCSQCIKCLIVNTCSLPEVPSIWDTACIHVDLPRDEENIQKQLVDAIKDYGRVIARAPVQIAEILERPAALLVKWSEVGGFIFFLPEVAAVLSRNFLHSFYHNSGLRLRCF